MQLLKIMIKKKRKIINKKVQPKHPTRGKENLVNNMMYTVLTIK